MLQRVSVSFRLIKHQSKLRVWEEEGAWSEFLYLPLPGVQLQCGAGSAAALGQTVRMHPLPQPGGQAPRGRGVLSQQDCRGGRQVETYCSGIERGSIVTA